MAKNSEKIVEERPIQGLISVQLERDDWFSLWMDLERLHGKRPEPDPLGGLTPQGFRIMKTIEDALIANGFPPQEEVLKLRKDSPIVAQTKTVRKKRKKL